MFKGYSTIAEPSVTEVIEDNIQTYIEWGFLKLEAFYNVSIPTSGTYGGNMHRLVSINDPRYTNGQVWEGFRKNWVWESGLATSEEPVAISGIFVDGSFLPKGSGYYVNYKNGQVVFDTAIDSTSTVQLEYSYKWVDVVSSNEIPWFRKGQTRSFRLDSPSFVVNSGSWSDLADNRLQLPIVAVESAGKTYEGYQLGGGQYARTDISLHVLAEDKRTATKLASILADQSESTVLLYDTGKMADDNKFPLDYRGELASGALCYPDLIGSGYIYTDKVQHGKMYILDSNEQEVDQVHENIYHSVVKWKTEVILHKI